MKITIDQIPQNVSIKSIVVDLDIDTSDVKILYQENKDKPASINNTNQNTINQNIQERKEIPVPPEMNMQF